MRITIVIFALFHLFSCVESDRDYLQRVSEKLSNISTASYTSELTFIEEGKVVYTTKGHYLLDFKDDNPNKIKFYSKSDEDEMLYNGFEFYNALNEEKIITSTKFNDPDILNSRFHLSLHYLKNALPNILESSSVTIQRDRDTIINSEPLLIFRISIDKSSIHFSNYMLEEGDKDSEYFLYVNKKDDLPYKIITPNGSGKTVNRTFENIVLAVKIDKSLWTAKHFPKEFERMTEDEYYGNRRKKIMSHKGKYIANLELPNIIDNSKVNLSELKGNVVLIDFWFKGCQPCIEAIPGLNNIATIFANKEFRLYGIEYLEKYNQEALTKYVEKNKTKYPNLYKGKEFAANYDIDKGPTFLIIDKKGKIVHIKRGYSEEGMEEIAAIIEKYI